jgi:hypothetical protein
VSLRVAPGSIAMLPVIDPRSGDAKNRHPTSPRRKSPDATASSSTAPASTGYRATITARMNGRNARSRKDAKPRLKARLGASYHACFIEPASAPAMWCGRITKHSIRLAISTTITVNGMSAIIDPNRPPIAISPKKASTVVSIAEKTGAAIRRAAFSAAIAGGSPRSRCRASACSPTTIASSTTIPRQSNSANSEIMLSVIPPRYMNATAAVIATGMPAATQNAVRAFRNTKSSPTTSTSPKAPLRNRMSSRSVISSARVRISSTRTPSGSVASSASAADATLACIPIASPASSRSTRITTAGLPATK